MNDLDIFKNKENIMKSLLNKMDSEASEAAKSI
jgi:hypothetical protein